MEINDSVTLEAVKMYLAAAQKDLWNRRDRASAVYTDSPNNFTAQAIERYTAKLAVIADLKAIIERKETS